MKSFVLLSGIELHMGPFPGLSPTCLVFLLKNLQRPCYGQDGRVSRGRRCLTIILVDSLGPNKSLSPENHVGLGCHWAESNNQYSMHSVHTSDFPETVAERIVGHSGWNWRKPVSRTFQDWSQDGPMLTEARKRWAEKGAKCLRIRIRKMVVLVSKFCLYL